MLFVDDIEKILCGVARKERGEVFFSLVFESNNMLLRLADAIQEHHDGRPMICSKIFVFVEYRYRATRPVGQPSMLNCRHRHISGVALTRTVP